MTPNDLERFVAAFAASVRDSVQSLQALLPIMNEERVALTGRNPESLSAIVARKQAMLQSLEQSVRDRDLLLARLGFPTGAGGVRQLLARCGDVELDAAWQHLTQLTRELNLANEMNGQLATQGLHAARGAIALLTGRELEQPVYGRGHRGRRPTTAYQTLAKV